MSDGDRTYKWARISLQKLSLQPKDVLIIKFPSDIAHAQMQEFLTQFHPHVPVGVTVLGSREGEVEYEKLDEKTMNAHGWYRKDEKDI